MNKLTIFGQNLRLKGHKNTLELADRHNRRLIATEIGGYGGIDGRKTPFNVELVPLNGTSLEEVVKKIITDKGIDLNSLVDDLFSCWELWSQISCFF